MDNDIYEESLANGCSPRLAEMLACRQAPASFTERDYFKAKGKLEKQFGGNEKHLNEMAKLAKKRGFAPNPNSVYEPAIAKYPCDPVAFIPPAGGLSYVREVAKRRGLELHGAVEVEGRPRPPKKQVRLAPRIVDNFERKYVQDNPDLARKPRRELREMIIEKHGKKLES